MTESTNVGRVHGAWADGFCWSALIGHLHAAGYNVTALPEDVKTHPREQIFCIGPDGLLRRYHHTVDVLGGAIGFKYASEYRDVDGIVFPTKRRVYGHKGDRQVVPEPDLAGVEIGAAADDGPADGGCCVPESTALLYGGLADAEPECPRRSVAHQPVG
jgi:hypothetical protein